MEKIMKKIAIFAFNGEAMCFAHALLNANDLFDKGYDVKLIIEGSATKQIKELTNPQKPFAKLYGSIKEKGLIDCVCKACANVMGVLASVTEQNLPLGNDLKGHPSIEKYIKLGYEIVIF